MDRFRLWLEATDKLYVRFGDVKPYSQVKLGREFDRQGEAGLSVYGVEKLDRASHYHGTDIFDRFFANKMVNPNQDHYLLDKPNTRQAIYSTGTDYWQHMLSQFGMQNRPIYLVTGQPATDREMHPEKGEYVEIPSCGADGEPLLNYETVQVIKELDPSQVFAPGVGLASDYYD